jgi:hypothetical protein
MNAEEFAKMRAFLQLSPDIGTRTDYLMTMVIQMLTRLEQVQGGHPPEVTVPAIRWGED